MSKKALRKEVTTTNAWINSSLYIDDSTGAVSTMGPLDEIEIDTSVNTSNIKLRPTTHLSIDCSALEKFADSNPYADLYANIEKAIAKFNN